MFLPLGKAVAFFAIQMAVFGFCLGASFAPRTRACRSSRPTMKLDFLRRQVMVSRNVRGNPVVDFFMGGLNYQIEHHLFPSMPRCNLKKARPLVRAHCEREGIGYMEVGLFHSYAIVVGLPQQRRASRTRPVRLSVGGAAPWLTSAGGRARRR